MKLHSSFIYFLGISIYSVICIEIRCPTDWVPRSGSSKCYYVSTLSQKTSWQGAREFCQDRGGDLAVVKDLQEKNWMMHTAGESINDTMFWVGLWDPLYNNVWKWVDNSSFSATVTPWYLTWAPSYYCALLTPEGKVYKTSCSLISHFMCERQIDKPILCDSDFGWEHIGNSCMKYVEDELEWYEAASECNYEGADIIIIDSLQKRKFVEDKAGIYKKNIWFGFTNMFPNFTYEWIYDKTGDVDNWQQFEPRNNTNPKNFTASCGSVPNTISKKWITEDCNTENPFVCEHVEGQCQSGWEGYRRSCYQWNFAKVYSRPWEEAKETCEKQGSRLLVIDDQVEQTFISRSLYEFTNEEYFTRDVWIGLSDVGYLPGTYTWVDGKTPADKKFSYWENSTSTGSTNCAKMIAGGNYPRWIIDRCDNLMSFICEAPLGAPIKPVSPTHAPLYCNSTAGWKQFGDYCYMFVKIIKTWPEAQKYCKDIYSNLASITTRAENTWISAQMVLRGHWIGLNSKADPKKWVWDDGEEVSFLNWAPGEPNGGGNLNKPESCVESMYSFAVSSKGKWNDHFCDEKKNSVCKRKADLNPDQVFTLAPTTPWSTKCGAYWLEDPYSHNCYRYDIERLTWHDARTHCQMYKGDLVSILSLGEQRFINDLISRATAEDPNIVEFWIGFTDITEEGRWKWSDNKPAPFFNWNPGEPNNVGKEDCATTFASHGRWNDLDCQKRLPYICKKSLAKIPIIIPVTYPPTKPGQRYACPKDWFDYRNECFYFSKDKKKWDDARTFCKVNGYGGDLATIKIAMEQSYIQSKLSSYALYDRLWIGLNDRDIEFEFRWIDGSSVTYTNWMANEPNHYAGNKEDCVNVYKDVTKPGGWNDDLCTNSWFYICRTLKQITDIPTAVPTAQGCRTGFEAYENGCYKFDTVSKTWNNAKLTCNAAKGQLVDILDRFEQTFITGRISTLNQVGNYWIGLNSQTPGTYTWSSGRPVSFSNWNKNQPDSSLKCVSALSGLTPGFWKTESCTTQLNSICKMPKDGFTFPAIPTTTPTPLKCPSYWRELNNFCYYEVYTYDSVKKKTFNEARKDCQVRGADLVSIHSKAEDDFIRNYVMYGLFWIGMRSEDGTRLYWVDGTGGQYFNWLEGEPDNHNGVELCVELDASKRGWQDSTCERKRDYICKASKDALNNPSLKPIITSTTSKPTTPAVVCGSDPNWQLFQGDCYFFTTLSATRATWSDARQQCRNNGAELLSIKSFEEQTYIMLKIGEIRQTNVMWIGLHALHEHGIYEWSDNTPLGFTNWAKGEPNNYGGSEACGGIYSDSGFWNDDNCAVLQGYICRKANNTSFYTLPPPTISIGNCPSGWNQFAGKCYKLFSNPSSWEGAHNQCMKLGGKRPDLLSIHSNIEQSFLITMLKEIKDNVWFGLTDLLSNRRWYWSDNSVFDFSNWNVDEPGSSWSRKGDCAVLLTAKFATGKWGAQICSNQNPFICQRTVDETISTPSPPIPCKKYQNEGFYQFGENCFHLLDKGYYSWSDAKDLCQMKADKSAVLASVMSIYEESFIRTFYSVNLSNFIWIGLSSKDKSNVYTWTNDQPVTYTNWAKNEPSKGEGEGCVAMMGNGQWNDTNCNLQLQGLCKIEYEKFSTHVPKFEGTCPNITNEWKPSFGQYCYLYREKVMKTYGDAAIECQRFRGVLATFDDKNEYDNYFNNLPRTSNIWIGLYKTFDGDIKWTDNSPLTFTNWATDEPSNGNNEYCVDIDIHNKWSDNICAQTNEFVCKANKVPISSTSPIPTAPPKTPPEPTKPPEGSTSKFSPDLPTLGSSSSIPPEPTASKETPKAEEVSGKEGTKLDAGATIAIIEATACIVVILLIIAFIIRRQKRNYPPKLGSSAHSFDNALYSADTDTVNIESYNTKKADEYNY